MDYRLNTWTTSVTSRTKLNSSLDWQIAQLPSLLYAHEPQTLFLLSKSRRCNKHKDGYGERSYSCWVYLHLTTENELKQMSPTSNTSCCVNVLKLFLTGLVFGVMTMSLHKDYKVFISTQSVDEAWIESVKSKQTFEKFWLVDRHYDALNIIQLHDWCANYEAVRMASCQLTNARQYDSVICQYCWYQQSNMLRSHNPVTKMATFADP